MKRKRKIKPKFNFFLIKDDQKNCKNETQMIIINFKSLLSTATEVLKIKKRNGKTNKQKKSDRAYFLLVLFYEIHIKRLIDENEERMVVFWTVHIKKRIFTENCIQKNGMQNLYTAKNVLKKKLNKIKHENIRGTSVTILCWIIRKGFLSFKTFSLGLKDIWQRIWANYFLGSKELVHWLRNANIRLFK